MTDSDELEKVRNIAARFGIQEIESTTYLGEGLIARNRILQVSGEQRYVLRSYDLRRSQELGYTRSRFEFEVTVLRFLDGRLSVATPSALITTGGEFHHVEDDTFYVLYRMIEGQILEQSDLSAATAREAGHRLREIVDIGSTFISDVPLETGGLDYIREIVGTLLERPEFERDGRLKELAAYANDFVWASALNESPHGIVHGDYFYENTLWTTEGKISGVIDFGDSFYGAALHDIAVGAMEFATTIGECVNSELMEAFLRPFEDWFARNFIDMDLFVAVLRLNCVRYSTHLASLGLEAGMSLDEILGTSYNPYIARFRYFDDRDALESISALFSNPPHRRRDR